MEELLHRTYSVCPVCLKRVPALRVRRDGAVYLRKACEEHGAFESVVWRDRLDLGEWIGGAEGAALGDPPCPDGCGLCAEHLQGTCCVLLEVTARCNLRCSFCFADGGADPGARADARGGSLTSVRAGARAGSVAEPSLEELKSSLARLAVPGKTLVQLSGGEPTLRDDLPDIVAAAKEAGCRYVQLNTNGLRLAEDGGYVRALAGAGLSFVFMQFDGTDDGIYLKLRGRPLFEIKKRAVEQCGRHNLGVTLVPTLVPGVNTDAIGEILRFGVSHSPAVRGVHFQPVSYFGRAPSAPADVMRFTLDELVAGIEEQSGGLVKRGQLLPSRCDHPLCGFHGDFVVDAEGRLAALSRRNAGEPCCGAAAADRNREFVARRWLRPLAGVSGARPVDLHNIDSFLGRVKTHGFTVTAMAFQDAGTLDVERLRRCSLHVFDDGRLVPFCAHYLTGWTA